MKINRNGVVMEGDLLVHKPKEIFDTLLDTSWVSYECEGSVTLAEVFTAEGVSYVNREIPLSRCHEENLSIVGILQVNAYEKMRRMEMESAQKVSRVVTLDALKTKAKNLFLELYYSAAYELPNPESRIPLVEEFIRVSWAASWGEATITAERVVVSIEGLSKERPLTKTEAEALELSSQILKFSKLFSEGEENGTK